MDEGTPLRGRPPRAPKHLSPAARQVWRTIAPALHRRGPIGPGAADLLSRYCEIEVVLRWAASELERGRPVITGRREHVVTSPIWRIYRDAVGLQLALAKSLGLL